jgi:hypothetical protein
MDYVREIQGRGAEVSCMVNRLLGTDTQQQDAAARRLLRAGQRQR